VFVDETIEPVVENFVVWPETHHTKIWKTLCCHTLLLFVYEKTNKFRGQMLKKI